MNTNAIDDLKQKSARVTDLTGKLEALLDSAKDTRAELRLAVKLLNKAVDKYPEEAVAAEVKKVVKDESASE